MRDDYMGSTFFDATASAYLLPTLPQLAKTPTKAKQTPEVPSTATNLSRESENPSSSQPSPSVHPDLINYDGQPSPRNCVGAIGFRDSNLPTSRLSVEGLDCELGAGKCQNVPGGGLGPDWLDALKLTERPAAAGADQVPIHVTARYSKALS